jgi:hypothetical protein
MTLATAISSSPPLRIGCGAGFSGDRWDAGGPVVDALASSSGPAVMMYETLAERTLALAHLHRQQSGNGGWEPSLARFVQPVLATCVEAGIPIVGNFGAANPAGAAHCVQEIAASLGLAKLRIAVVEGDDLLATLSSDQLHEVLPPQLRAKPLVSANAYLGAQQIAQALQEGAQVVVTGRVADPSLALGPLIAHYGWSMDDWDRLARGTMAGHLLECGGQVTGGYFADPGVKDVPGVEDIGFPILEIDAEGEIVVTKPRGTGGCVTRRTVTEQLLYEIHDPAAYLTPDVVADISDAQVQELGGDRVRVTGVRGHARPDTLKATICYQGGWLAEGEISYAGPNAAARARLAGQIVGARVRKIGIDAPVRCDLIGVTSLFADDAGRWWDGASALPERDDVRLRVAAATTDRDTAERINREVLALYTCGPAGGGGVRTHVTPRLSSDSAYVPREWVRASWKFCE